MYMKYLSFSLLFLVTICIVTGSAQTTPPDSDPVIISAPAFAISADDEAAGIDGTVKLAVEISKSGTVGQASVYIGPSWPCSVNLDKRVTAVMRDLEKSVRQYKFSPALSNGKPVDSRIGLSIKIGRSAKAEVGAKGDPGVPAKPKLISGGIVNGKAKFLPKPEYPNAAKSSRASGAVSVQILIGEDGNIINAQAISGMPELQFAARAAACGAKFSPTTLAGEPVKVSGVLIYNFVL